MAEDTLYKAICDTVGESLEEVNVLGGNKVRLRWSNDILWELAIGDSYCEIIRIEREKQEWIVRPVRKVVAGKPLKVRKNA